MDIKNIAYAGFKGFYDSFRGMLNVIYMDREINEKLRQSPNRVNARIRQKNEGRETTPIRHIKDGQESKVFKRIFQCGTLNGLIFLASIILFEYGLLPGLNFLLKLIFGEDSFMGKLVWTTVEPILNFTFKTIWVVPLFLLSKVVNTLWFMDIADSAYKHSRGRPQYTQSLSKMCADSIFSVVIQALFLIQAMLTSFIPIYMVGYGLSLIQMCMLHALYAFEYKWCNMGWELHKRLAFIETNWPYFIGFGLPLAVLTQMYESWIVNGCIFSIIFPLFIISGNSAMPVTTTCNFPLHFFSPVIALSNAFFSRTIGRIRK